LEWISRLERNNQIQSNTAAQSAVFDDC
jgi:hypothetical protein